VLLDDLGFVCRAREVAGELVGGYKTWYSLELRSGKIVNDVLTGHPPTTRTSTCSLLGSELLIVPACTTMTIKLSHSSKLCVSLTPGHLDVDSASHFRC
jgi:hypothetical protein